METPTKTEPAVKDLWCATCGAHRGTTDRPKRGAHQAKFKQLVNRRICHNDTTFQD